MDNHLKVKPTVNKKPNHTSYKRFVNKILKTLYNNKDHKVSLLSDSVKTIDTLITKTCIKFVNSSQDLANSDKKRIISEKHALGSISLALPENLHKR